MADKQDRKPAASPFLPQTFDPREEYSVVQRRLPHWLQAGAVAFITWRTWDSMPAKVIDTWLAERDEILKRLGASVLISLGEMKGHLAEQDEYYEAALQKLPRHLAWAVKQAVADRWNEHLDALHGECVLRRPELGRIVADSLKRFHGNRYVLTDYVVMPNHVHLLAAFADEAAMLAQCDSWKHYTAREINRLLGRNGASGNRTASTTWFARPRISSAIGGTLPRIRPAHGCGRVSMFMSGWRYRRRSRLLR